MAVVLTPFYRIVAKGCLQRGIAEVFDPWRWWSAWCIAYREMKGVPAVAATAEDRALLTDGSEVPGGEAEGCRAADEAEASAALREDGEGS